MKKREKFIDAMADIDEDLLVVHAQAKKPTKAQKIRKYAGAAAIYVAACLVVVLILPFIIGKDEPKPQPGGNPILVETHSPATDDPEARKINAADIYKTYCEVDPEKMSEPVTLDEVKAIIAAAEKAYAEYDIVILQDETAVETTPKKPDVKFSDLKGSGEEDSKIEDYQKYHGNMMKVIWEAFDARLPEGIGVYGPDPTLINECDGEEYLISFDVYDDEAENGNSMICLDYDKNGVGSVMRYKYDKDGEMRASDDYKSAVYPDLKTRAILGFSRRDDLPVASSEFDGLELTILLEKDCYLINENITATVILENVGDEARVLYQDDDLHFLDDIVFLENGEERPQYSEEKKYT